MPARRPARTTPDRLSRRLRLEPLEDRTVPAAYAVTTTADRIDPVDGVLSLREAVLAANASIGVADTITLPAGAYVLTIAGAGEDAGWSGDLDITDGLTIQGAGPASTVIDGNQTDRVFDVRAGGVMILGLQVVNGLVAGNAVEPAASGGGIRGQSALTLVDCVVTRNQAVGTNVAGAGGTVFGGIATGGGIAAFGAALTVTTCVVSDNVARGGAASASGPAGAAFGGAAEGGGVYVWGGAVTVTSSVLTGNRALGGAGASTAGAASGGNATGGGLVVHSGDGMAGVSQLALTTVADNRAVGGLGSGLTVGSGGAASGGGVAANAAGALVTHSTLSGNEAVGGVGVARDAGFGGAAFGGGAQLFSPAVTNSTVSGNRAVGGAGTTDAGSGGRGGNGLGGGLYASGGTVTAATVTANVAAAGASNRFAGTGVGGGFASNTASGTGTTFRNTIVAGNAAATSAPDLNRPALTQPSSLGANLIGDGAGAAGFANGVGGDQVGSAPSPLNPLLAPLADNGGPTRTHALLADSPAVNRGSVPAGIVADQRGVGFARTIGPAVDIGAYEAAAPWATTTPGNVSAGNFTIVVVYSDVAAIDVSTIGAGDIRVTGPQGYDTLAEFVQVNLTTNGTPRRATYRITPPGGSWDVSDNGTYTIAIVSSEVRNTAGMAVATGALGTFQANKPPPSATGTFANVTSLGGAAYTFGVTYTGILPATLGPGDVRVSGPNGFSAPADFVGFTPPPPNGGPYTATYRIIPPGGDWDGADNGTFTVAVEPSQVTDAVGNPVAAGAIGTFAVNIATFRVVNVNDAGPGSLRAAIAGANAHAGPDTIAFDAAFFGVPRTISLTTGPLTVTDALTVPGPGAGLLTLSGNDMSRVLFLDGRGGSFAAALSGLRLAGGRVTGPDLGSAGGGAVLALSTDLALTACDLTGNHCDGDGGAVYATGGSLTVRDCTVTSNTAGQSGGGVATSDVVATVRGSLVADNVSLGRNGGGLSFQLGTNVVRDCKVENNVAQFSDSSGGGIYCQGNLTVRESTVSKNRALDGAGISWQSSPGGVIRNTTVSENAAGGGGGGLWLAYNPTINSPVAIQNSTFTRNSVVSDAGNGGAGMYIDNPASPVSITSSIVSGNTTGEASRPDDIVNVFAANPIHLNSSAVGSPDGFTVSADSGNNLAYGIDLKLGLLADNGGPTRTVALLPGSPAIDAGSNPAGLLIDQRGSGFARVYGSVADIGAYEVQAPYVQSVVVNRGEAQRSRVTEITVTFSHLVSLPANLAAAFRLTRSGPGGPIGDVTLAVDLSGSTASRTVARITFAGFVTEFGSLVDGTYALIVLGSQITGPGGRALDGDGNGSPGGDGGTSLHRLFGDANGDRLVNGADLSFLAQQFGGKDTTFDFDGNGVVNGGDLSSFVARFGLRL